MDPRYPIGPYTAPAVTSAAQRAQWIEEIAATPAALRAAVSGMSEAQLDTPYRDGGWTARQVVHHLPDSHIHAWVRMKSALTEERPAVRAYDEVAYAGLPDYRDAPVETSLALLEQLHARWVVLLRSLTEADFERVYVHSADGPVRLDQQLALYAWHGRHHVAHITSLRDRLAKPEPLPEPWMRGPLEGVDPLVQPLFFSFTQVREDLARYTQGVTQEQLWRRTGSVPSLGFHLRHIAGSVERLTTYLMGEQISAAQLAYLKQESEPGATLEALLDGVDAALGATEARLRTLDPASAHEPRYIGRKRLPTTVLGLLVHIAEHTQRHLGQAITTAKLVRG